MKKSLILSLILLLIATIVNPAHAFVDQPPDYTPPGASGNGYWKKFPDGYWIYIDGDRGYVDQSGYVEQEFTETKDEWVEVPSTTNALSYNLSTINLEKPFIQGYFGYGDPDRGVNDKIGFVATNTATYKSLWLYDDSTNDYRFVVYDTGERRFVFTMLVDGSEVFRGGNTESAFVSGVQTVARDAGLDYQGNSDNNAGNIVLGPGGRRFYTWDVPIGTYKTYEVSVYVRMYGPVAQLDNNGELKVVEKELYHDYSPQKYYVTVPTPSSPSVSTSGGSTTARITVTNTDGRPHYFSWNHTVKYKTSTGSETDSGGWSGWISGGSSASVTMGPYDTWTEDVWTQVGTETVTVTNPDGTTSTKEQPVYDRVPHTRYPDPSITGYSGTMTYANGRSIRF